MPERKSKNSHVRKTINCLRKSPRLHCETQISAENPRTPNLAETRRCRPDSFSTPSTKTKETCQGVSVNGGEKMGHSNSEKSRNGCRRSARTQHRENFSSLGLEKKYAKEKPQTRSLVGVCRSLKGLDESVEGSRRSERRGRGANVGKCGEVVIEKRVTRSSIRRNKVVVHVISDSDSDLEEDSGKVVIEKRVTRSSIRRNKVVGHEISDSDWDSEEDSGESPAIAPKKRKNKTCVDKEKNVGEIEKRATRSFSKTCMKKATDESNNSSRKAVVSDKVELKGDDELSKVDTSKEDEEDGGVVRGIEEQNHARKAVIGEKRKRNGITEECETALGWSKEQEFALQRAYFTAKPTPQFWKKVSRMVPGKSAEECFDKIYSDHSTPPQPRTRSRAKVKELSPLAFSVSELLDPAVKKIKRLGIRRKTLAAQKTVRHILQKQQKEDQDYKADLFAVLEPTISPVVLQKGAAAFISPASNKASPFLSRLSSSSKRLDGPAFTSPPVLKQIKNKALHEKYIDQLHCRDAKRKAEALRNSRNGRAQMDDKVNHLEQNFVKVVKDALVSDAKDAITKFQSLLCRAGDDDSASRSDCEEDEDDEDLDGV